MSDLQNFKKKKNTLHFLFLWLLEPMIPFLLAAPFFFMILNFIYTTKPYPTADYSGHLYRVLTNYSNFSWVDINGNHPPLVYLLSMGLFKLFSPSWETALLSIAIFIFPFAFSIYYSGRILGNRWVGILATLLVISSPYILNLTNIYMLDFPMIVFFNLSLLFVLASKKFENKLFSLLLGAAMGMGGLTRYSFFFYIIPPLGLYGLFFFHKSFKSIVLKSLTLIIFIVSLFLLSRPFFLSWLEETSVRNHEIPYVFLGLFDLILCILWILFSKFEKLVRASKISWIRDESQLIQLLHLLKAFIVCAFISSPYYLINYAKMWKHWFGNLIIIDGINGQLNPIRMIMPDWRIFNDSALLGRIFFHLQTLSSIFFLAFPLTIIGLILLMREKKKSFDINFMLITLTLTLLALFSFLAPQTRFSAPVFSLIAFFSIIWFVRTRTIGIILGVLLLLGQFLIVYSPMLASYKSLEFLNEMRNDLFRRRHWTYYFLPLREKPFSFDEQNLLLRTELDKMVASLKEDDCDALALLIPSRYKIDHAFMIDNVFLELQTLELIFSQNNIKYWIIEFDREDKAIGFASRPQEDYESLINWINVIGPEGEGHSKKFKEIYSKNMKSLLPENVKNYFLPILHEINTSSLKTRFEDITGFKLIPSKDFYIMGKSHTLEFGKIVVNDTQISQGMPLGNMPEMTPVHDQD